MCSLSRVFGLTVVFGLFHGLGLLPVLLAHFGPVEEEASGVSLACCSGSLACLHSSPASSTSTSSSSIPTSLSVSSDSLPTSSAQKHSPSSSASTSSLSIPTSLSLLSDSLPTSSKLWDTIHIYRSYIPNIYYSARSRIWPIHRYLLFDSLEE